MAETEKKDGHIRYVITKMPQETGCRVMCPIRNSDAPWTRLPAGCIILIFKYLDDEDQFCASKVFTGWKRVYRLPCIWRTKHLSLTDSPPREINWNARRERDWRMAARHMRHVTLEFLPWTRYKFALKRLNWSLKVLDMYATNECRSIEIINIFYLLKVTSNKTDEDGMFQALCVLFNKLPNWSHMQRIDLASSQVACLKRKPGRPEWKSTFLETSVSPMTFYPFYKYMRRIGYTFLTYLSINEWYLTEGILRRIAEASTMLRLKIWVTSTTYPSAYHVSSVHWQHVKRSCPLLRVTVHFLEICSVEKYSTLLVQDMPLDEVFLTGLGRWERPYATYLSEMGNLLSHLADYFCKTMTRLEISAMPENEVCIDGALLHFINSCVALRSLHVTLKIRPDTLSHFIAILSDGRHNDLHSIYLCVTEDFADMTSVNVLKAIIPNTHVISRKKLCNVNRQKK